MYWKEEEEEEEGKKEAVDATFMSYSYFNLKASLQSCPIFSPSLVIVK